MIKKMLLGFLLLLALLLLTVGAAYYLAFHSVSGRQWLLDKTLGDLGRAGKPASSIPATVGARLSPADLLAAALGLKQPVTYLVLFLNNTELRPGGGFIGVYGVATMDKGNVEIIKIEGTEILDLNAPAFDSPPPAPLAQQLKIKQWGLRDSNWSPDFKISALKALELYQKEGGVLSDKIDVVVGITPTVAEELLEIIGPVTVDGLEFTAQNFTEKLEYEVEVGYKDKAVDKSGRKDIIADLADAFIIQMRRNLLFRWQEFVGLARRLLQEKQVMLFARDQSMERALSDYGWSGEMKKPAGDYLLWADANLAALKTDAAIKRALSYSIVWDKTNSRYVGTFKMKYEHQGKFDWRTTRYRTYARIFLPAGSRPIAGAGVDSGEQDGYVWLGQLIAVEPGQSKEAQFSFELSPPVAADIAAGAYTLFVQKQLGTIATGLTLGLEFDKKVIAAFPAEAREKWGDNRYDFATDLRVDREFEVNF